MMRRPLEMTASTDNKLISVIMTSSMRMNTGVRIGLLSFDSYLCILRWISFLEHSSMFRFDETYFAFLRNMRTKAKLETGAHVNCWIRIRE